MFGRRSHQRFTISTSPEGTLRLLCDVLVERAAQDEIFLISRRAAVVGDSVTIEWGDLGVPLRVAASRPLVSDGTVRHRLSLVSREAGREFDAHIKDIVPSQDHTSMLAVMAREIPVRLMNCSASGCLLECTAPIEVGRIATLRVAFDGQELVDDLQVVRCLPIEGSSFYHAGVEFLWTAPLGNQSLRLRIGGSGDMPAHSAEGV